jgi:predicted DNA-binding transcriptional regulator AlpA
MKFIRFPDLVAKGVVNSRMTLKRLIDTHGFPPGKLITPNARAWSEAEVDAWVNDRPTTRKGPQARASRAEVPVPASDTGKPTVSDSGEVRHES